TLDVGAISGDGDSLNATNQIIDGQFEIPQAQLKELATSDDALRQFRNIFMNTDPATGKYIANEPYFEWSGSMATALNGYSKPEDLQYMGYGIYFDSNRDDLKLASLCNSTASAFKKLKLVPPKAIESGSYHGEEET